MPKLSKSSKLLESGYSNNLKPYIILESFRIRTFVEKIERNHLESRGFAR